MALPPVPQDRWSHTRHTKAYGTSAAGWVSAASDLAQPSCVTAREQRRSRRYEARLPVSVTRGRSRVLGTSRDVSRHGLFVQPESPLPERMLLRFTIDLPDGPMDATGFVVNLRKDGCGIQFFALGSSAKARWDAFVASAATGRRFEPAQELTPREDVANFLVRLDDPKKLREFFERKIKSGEVFINTPLTRPPGAKVALILIHPDSEREFMVQGSVTPSTDAHRGMTLRLDPVTPKMEARFADFVFTGQPSETMDLMTSPAWTRDDLPSNAPSVPEPNADTFREDSDDLEDTQEMSMAFAVDDATGDLSLDIAIDDDVLAALAEVPPQTPSAPAGAPTVRCTACGAFLGPAELTPVPYPLSTVAERRCVFDRYAGRFSSRVLPRSAAELDAAARDLEGTPLDGAQLVELARLLTHDGDVVRGPDLAPVLRAAAASLEQHERVDVAASCPMCMAHALVASQD